MANIKQAEDNKILCKEANYTGALNRLKCLQKVEILISQEMHNVIKEGFG